jgi:hypothetical protein
MNATASTSKFWLSYFRRNARRALKLGGETALLPERERAKVARSLQCFELGEASEGRKLLEKAAAYARGAGDPHYAEALGYLVREENRHSAYLRYFMKCQSIPRIRNTWTDVVFRWLRNLAGLELSIRTLVSAETIAIPYYQALATATCSPLLQVIAERILEEEKQHVRFQWASIARMNSRKGPFQAGLCDALHTLFVLGTATVAWMEHRTVFRGRFTYFGYLKAIHRKHLSSMIWGRKNFSLPVRTTA